MITFAYEARNANGELVKSSVQAESQGAAAKLLTSQKLFPVSITAVGSRGVFQNFQFGNRIKPKDRVVFTRQLATLINAGLPLLPALRTVKTQLANKNLQVIIGNIVSSVEGGGTLATAFGSYPDIFGQVYVSLISAGESSGTLDKVLVRLATQQEKDAAVASRIRGALLYPSIVLGVITAVLVFLVTTLVPQVASLYKDLNKPIPVLTKILIVVANILTSFWWVVMILSGAGAYFLVRYIKTPAGKRMVDTWVPKTPIIGRMMQKIYMARFARTLGTLLASGVHMLEALAIVKTAVNNTLVAGVLEHSLEQVRGGRSLSSSLEGSPHFLPLVPQMIKIGEESGTTDQMLERLASNYEQEVEDEVKNLGTTLEPALMVVLGVIVGIVILAVLGPVYNLVGQGVTTGTPSK